MTSEYKLSAIKLGFENCCTATIPIKFIERLTINDITSDYSLSWNSFEKSNKCGKFVLSIHNSANEIVKILPGNYKENLFERIEQHADICDIKLIFRKQFFKNIKKYEIIKVPWYDSANHNNPKFQKTLISNHGDMLIVISSSEFDTIEKCFDINRKLNLRHHKKIPLITPTRY